ncbi:MAG: TonB-dependent receptor [Opitutaceae bacterium]|nr:TonB-dependent receptor [Opitutaceae bacterium]
MTHVPCSRIVLFTALAALGAANAQAGEPATVMSPFKVGAQDILRVQNSSTLLNAYLLEQHGVVQLQDITGIAPNLSISNSDSRGFGDVIALRGLANTIFFSAPSVALYVDDVPGGSVSSYSSSLLNIASFQVQAGPQGTSYGRNAAAGVIDIHTREPGDKHHGRIVADFGSFKALALQAAFDGPISAQTGYSLSLGTLNREGYIDNTSLRRPADDRSSFSGRGYVYYKPDATLRLRFGAFVENVSDDAPRLSSLASRDPFKVASDLLGQTQLDRQQYSFQARKKLSVGTLTATTSWQNYDLDPAITDLDLNAFPGASSRVTQAERTWTQEIRYESEPGADKSQLRAGLFFSDGALDSTAVRSFVVPPSMFVPPNFVQTERTVYSIDQRSLAAYVNYEQPVAGNLVWDLGGRVEQARSALDRTKTSSNNLGFPSPADPRLVASMREADFSGTTGLRLALAGGATVHVRTSLAHRPPGHSGFTANAALAAFKAERSWANEAGITFGAPKGRFGAGLVGFWNTIDDHQFERTVPGSTDYVVVNANEVRARGVEAKLMWQAADQVWWDFQAGYNDTTFRSHRTATGRSAAGKRVPFVPESTLRTGVTVDFGGGFSGNASYALVGRTFYDESETAATAQRRYSLVNAQLRYRHGQWATTLYAQNVGDKNYYQFINPEIFAGSPGAPRRWGVQVTFEY